MSKEYMDAQGFTTAMTALKEKLDDKYAVQGDIPTKTSNLTNDSNFVSDASYVHTDNNYSTADKNSVGQIPGITNDLSQLESDVDALTTEVASKANQSDLNALTNRVGEVENNAVTLDRRVTNLEYCASRGVLYREETNITAAYSKALDADVMPWGQLTTIGGKSVVWNQFAIMLGSGTSQGVTVTVNADNTINLNGTIGALPYNQFYLTRDLIFKRDGSKYYVKPNQTMPNRIGVIGFTAASDSENGFIWSDSAGGTWNGLIFLRANEGDEISLNNLRISVINLTQMYGAGNEPTTTSDPRIAEIEAYLTLHPEYNSGEIVSAKVDKVVSTSASDAVIAEYPIPSEVQALEGYGESNGTKVNYIDYSAKKFIAYGHYVNGAWVDYAEPIQTDISAYLNDNAINVEGGGSLTFHQNGTEFVVPNSENFLIKTGG